MIILKNVVIISPPDDPGRREKIVVVEDGRILGIHDRLEMPDADVRVIDGQGMFLTPGFIDIHVHGGAGHGVAEADPGGICAMCSAHARRGTTSILPTLSAASPDLTRRAIDAVKAARERATDSNILGIHLEGPFLSSRQKGAQQSGHMLLPESCDYEELLNRWDGIRIMGAAPELPGGLALGRALQRRNILASIAHSDATFDQVAQAIQYGYSDVTHLYSGCSSVIRRGGFRIAGVVEAGLYFDDLTVQVIADLKHLPVSLLKLIYKCKGADRISLISDGIDYACMEMKDGTLLSRGKDQYIYEDGVLKTGDRQAFAGSVASSSQLVRNMHIYAGIPLYDAVRMASLTPAKCIGLSGSKGRVAPGYDADLVLLDHEIRPRMVMTAGRIVRGLDDPE